MVRRVLRGVLILLISATVLIVAGGLYARSQVRASLAQLDGQATIAGLGADVRVDRDALGVPTISAASREDVARALGFLHAQDRFFQMDFSAVSRRVSFPPSSDHAHWTSMPRSACTVFAASRSARCN